MHERSGMSVLGHEPRNSFFKRDLCQVPLPEILRAKGEHERLAIGVRGRPRNCRYATLDDSGQDAEDLGNRVVAFSREDSSVNGSGFATKTKQRRSDPHLSGVRGEQIVARRIEWHVDGRWDAAKSVGNKMGQQPLGLVDLLTSSVQVGDAQVHGSDVGMAAGE